MIVPNESPRWIREFARYLSVKNLLILHGNVLDRISYPMSHPESGEVEWVDGNSVIGFLQRFLLAQGYGIVGVYEPLEGLAFSDADMRKRYQALARRPEAEIAPARQGASQDPAATENGDSACIAPPDDASIAGGARAAMPQIYRALGNRHTPCAFVFNLASRLAASPETLSDGELALFTQFLRASRDATEVSADYGRLRNALILVCDKPNDLPAFLYLNNPRAISICIDRPNAAERGRLFKSLYHGFHGADSDDAASEEQAGQFAARTEGLTYSEINSLVGLSRNEKLGVDRIEALLERYKYGVTTSEWDSVALTARLQTAEERIRRRVKGQEAAVARTLDMVKRARLGLAAGASGQSHRPRGVLFFAGPSGVGKTEMAKALAELLFDDESRLLRFDMSEYRAEHADQRLLGAPPGYLGYSEGGQLTNRVKENPFSVLLFDEIEKAHPRIFDQFLQVLDDGRLTDGRGETVYFSQCVIVFTSNLGTVHTDAATGQSTAVVTPDMSYENIQKNILDAIKNHFRFALGRPEILNRFGDNFVVFDFIQAPHDEEIVTMLVDQFCHAAAIERDIHITLTPQARNTLVELAREKLDQGGRGIRNVLDAALINPFSRWLYEQDLQGSATPTITDIRDNGPNAPYRYELVVGD